MVSNREPLQVWEEDFPTASGDTSSAGVLALAFGGKKKGNSFFFFFFFFTNYSVTWASLVTQVKNPPVNAGDTGDAVWVPGSGRFPARGNGNPLQ